MSERPLMKCGCVAQGHLTRKDGAVIDPPLPVCVIHDCAEPAPEMPDLAGRKALCAYGGAEVDSSYSLAFFEYRPNADTDQYYCGCHGWD